MAWGHTGKRPSYVGGRQLYVKNDDGDFVPIDVKLPGREPKYPLHKLQVGQSFFIPFYNKKPGPMRSIYERASKLEIKVKQRCLTENGQPGLRVWRME